MPPKLELPKSLETIAFIEAWQGWLESRKKLKKEPTVRAKQLWLRKLEAWGEQRAIAALDHSAMGSWVGIYEPKPEQLTASPYAAAQAKPPTTWELKTKLEALEPEICHIKARGYEDAFGWHPASAEDSARLKVLRAEQRRLRGLMAEGVGA